MEEEKLKAFAKQLRKPEGEYGREVGEKMNEGNRYINESTIRELSVGPGDSILEVGMGNGFFVKDILSVDASVRYAGCDFSADMIEESVRRNKNYIEEGRARFVEGNVESLPFEDGSFNKAFTINTLYFWENREKALSEFRRVLKPGGKLLIAIRPKANMEQIPFTQYGFSLFSKEDLSALLTANGFKVINTTEIEEPEKEVNGKKVVLDTLIVAAEK